MPRSTVVCVCAATDTRGRGPERSCTPGALPHLPSAVISWLVFPFCSYNKNSAFRRTRNESRRTITGNEELPQNGVTILALLNLFLQMFVKSEASFFFSPQAASSKLMSTPGWSAGDWRRPPGHQQRSWISCLCSSQWSA